MVIECITIIVLLAVMAFIYLRKGRKEYAHAIFPMILLPLVHIAAVELVRQSLFSIDVQVIQIALDIAALVVSCLLTGVSASHIQSRRARNGLVIISALFLIALASILIYSILVIEV